MGIGHSGLSGVRAATYELSTIGNNVSNAGTVGFKKSGAQFSDVISGSVGGGVEIAGVRQTFTQGSIQGTGNTWDLAISGRGFFKVSEGSDDADVAVKDNFYTRNGAFSMDADGYVVNSFGMRLHMYEAKNNTDGTVDFPVSTNTTEIQIEQSDAKAKATETIFGTYNLDARIDPRGSAVVTGDTAAIAERLVVGSTFKLNGTEVEVTGNASVTAEDDARTLTANDKINLNGTEITTAGTTVADFVTAINAVKDTTGVTATENSSGRLVLSSSTDDIVLSDVGAGTTMYNLGLHTDEETVTDEQVTPAVTRTSLVNDINNTGTGVTASLVDDAIKLYSTSDIKVEAGTVTDTGDDETTNDVLSFAGLTATTEEVSLPVGTDGTIDPVDPSDDLTYDHSVTSIIYDTLGGKQTLNAFFRKVTDGKWEVFGQRVDGQGTTYPANNETSLKIGEIEFDSSGVLSKITSGADGATIVYDTTVLPKIETSTKLTIAAGDATIGDAGVLELDIGKTTQFASEFRIVDIEQDGYASGSLTGVNVGEDGVISANYTNGNTIDLGKVALFEFNNAQGLHQEGGVLWAATNDSGDARPGEPGESIFGRVKSMSLESSSVDVTEELVNLITAQRNFQANSKMISASKEMNQVVLNI